MVQRGENPPQGIRAHGVRLTSGWCREPLGPQGTGPGVWTASGYRVKRADANSSTANGARALTSESLRRRCRTATNPTTEG